MQIEIAAGENDSDFLTFAPDSAVQRGSCCHRAGRLDDKFRAFPQQ